MGKIIRTVAIIYNLKRKALAGDACEEYDEIETIQALEKEIIGLGFKVLRFEQTQNLAVRLLRRRPDFVLNIAEGLNNSRSREAQVPCILESLKIPYWGSDPIALGITLDKYLTYKLLKQAKIPVPEMVMISQLTQLTKFKSIFKKYSQVIVKPRWEGSSKGIFLDSAANNFKDLTRLVKRVIEQYQQPAVVEEFLSGQEITVGLCGNNPPKVLGMIVIMPQDKTKQKNFIYSLENKRQWQQVVEYQSQNCLKPKIKAAVAQWAIKAFDLLELKDMARIDFRLNQKQLPKIIDVNPLPGLSPRYSDLPIICKNHGRPYSQLIKLILKSALQRQKLSD